MKLALRVFAFSLCLAATYSAATFNTKLAASSKPKPAAPMPTCNPSWPTCSI